MDTPVEQVLSRPWGGYEIPSEGILPIELGPLRLWAQARSGEIWIAKAPGVWNRTADHTGEPSDEKDWVRWPIPDGGRRIRLTPLFPPRPVIVEPELAFRLLPSTQARIFVRVPLWVRIECASEGAAVLTELPTLVLSDTWWGGPTEGELCYWLPTTARRQVEPVAFSPHLAVCPLQLSNDSEDELQVEEIALRVAHLSIFSEEGRLWADETRVQYRGDDEGSEIDMAGRAPRETSHAIEVAKPRSPLPRGFRARTFARLRTLSELAGL